MKKAIYISLFCLFSFVSNGQEATTKLKVTRSVEFKDAVKVGSIKVMHTSATGKTGIVRFGKKDILVDVFNTNLGKEFTQRITKERRERYKGHLSFGDNIYVFTTFSPKLRERELYCYIINLEEKTKTKKKLFKIDVKNANAIYSKLNTAEASFSVSPNQEYIAVATYHTTENNNSYLIHVYEAKTLSLVYKTKYDAGENNEFFEPNDLLINDDTSVYVLGRQFKDGKLEKISGKANYEFSVHKISENITSENAIVLNEEHIQSLVLSYKNNELHLIGFYSERNTSRVKGGCDFVLDETTLAVKTKKINELPKQVYEDLYGYRNGKRKKKKSKELRDFIINYIIDDSQGNTYLLAEEYYTSSANNFGLNSYTIKEHYDDILILKFDVNGNLNWGRSIYKQATEPSYNVFLKNDELHVILNSGKNLLEKKDGRTKVSQGMFESSALYDIVYSSTGTVAYNKIQDNKGKTYFTPFYGTYIDGVFIMANSQKKKKQFLKLE